MASSASALELSVADPRSVHAHPKPGERAADCAGDGAQTGVRSKRRTPSVTSRTTDPADGGQPPTGLRRSLHRVLLILGMVLAVLIGAPGVASADTWIETHPVETGRGGVVRSVFCVGEDVFARMRMIDAQQAFDDGAWSAIVWWGDGGAEYGEAVYALVPGTRTVRQAHFQSKTPHVYTATGTYRVGMWGWGPNTFGANYTDITVLDC